MNDLKEAQSNQLVDHFFRHEYAKMVAVITRYFGPHQIELAEEVVQDTLLEAMKSWDFKGIPENPAAWLYTVAKNKALNRLKRSQVHQKYENEIRHQQVVRRLENSVEELFSEDQIADDLLRMMFVCCHPAISPDSQIALMLKTICGLSIGEIAKAYITTNDVINKRLVRARKKLRQANVQFELPHEDELDERLDIVLETIYLLFNAGYNATKGDRLIKMDLCLEAVRLARLIVDNSLLREKSKANALLALMLLNGARFEARQDKEGNLIEMSKQDRSIWDRSLINQGLGYLDKLNHHREVSIYHILATISAYHCTAKDDQSTDWHGILALYDGLLTFEPSPVVHLNRAIAISKVKGGEEAIRELNSLKKSKALHSYYPLYSTLAELHMGQKEFPLAQENLTKAMALTELDSEIRLLREKLDYCEQQID